MNKWLWILIGLAAESAQASVPPQITYQGTLKQSGAAANGPHTVIFRLTDGDGLQQYWTSGTMTVNVVQGLFSAELSPQGMDWRAVTPFIEVNVDGQTLLPREQITSGVYAQLCASVADGSVLSGMIAMFENDCPSGWTLFAGLKGRFPVGQDPSNPALFSAGESGGALEHVHGISLDGAHNHGGLTGPPNREVDSDAGHNFASPVGGHLHSIATDGAHDHGGQTASAGSLPPYLAVVFCKKL